MKGEKVLFLLTGLEYGGAEIQVFELSSELRRRGWHVDVVSMIPPGPLKERFEREGIRVQHLGMRRGVPSPGAITRFAGMVRRAGPALVHSHMVHANLLARAARPFFGRVPLVNSGHNTREGSRWRYWAYRFTDRFCDRFHTVSRLALDEYVRGRFVSADKLFHLPVAVRTGEPPVDAAAASRVRAELDAADDFVFASVGRLEPQKDQAGLLRAFARVREQSAAKLWLVGTGELRALLEQQAGELGIGDAVRFLGARSDVTTLMRAADVFVLSSSWEGLPVVVLEAAMAECPVVTTAVGDLPFLIEDGRSGRLVEPGDADALGDAMLHVLELDPVERAALATRLRGNVIDQCDLAKIVDAFERVYAELLDEPGP